MKRKALWQFLFWGRGARRVRFLGEGRACVRFWGGESESAFLGKGGLKNPKWGWLARGEMCLKNPKWAGFDFWGVFWGVNVSQSGRFLWFGMHFCSDCIPNGLILRIWGVFWGANASQISCFSWFGMYGSSNISNGGFFEFWDIFNPLLYLKWPIILNLRYFLLARVSQIAKKDGFEIFLPSSCISNDRFFWFWDICLCLSISKLWF